MVESVYSAVRTDAWFKTDYFSSLKGFKECKQTSKSITNVRRLVMLPLLTLSALQCIPRVDFVFFSTRCLRVTEHCEKLYCTACSFSACVQNYEKRTSSCLFVRLYVWPSVLPSARPHGTTRLPLDGFSWNFLFQYFFSKICRENSNLIKIWEE
jgi:hypothetical protein